MKTTCPVCHRVALMWVAAVLLLLPACSSDPDAPSSGPEPARAPDPGTLWCNEHGVPESECGICHPELLAQDPTSRGLKVRLPSAESAEKAGIVVETAAEGSMEDGIRCFAEFQFNQNRVVRITPLVGGLLASVEVDLGGRVRQGDLLATLTSPELGEDQGAWLTARAEERLRARELERARDLRSQQIASEQEYQEAEAAHQASTAALRQARQRLLVLGLDDNQITALADQRSLPGVLELRAPFDGEIVERSAVRGAVVDAGENLLTLADTSVMWAMVNIPESQLARVAPGLAVELTVEALPGHTFPGTLTWLSAAVDDRTRMVLGRVEVGNADGRLKAQMFARAWIATSRTGSAVVVPVSAVQTVTGTPVVFVRAEDDLFEARTVTLGARLDGKIEIETGLRPDDPVVVAGGFALKSQLLVSRLGAGCVDE